MSRRWHQLVNCADAIVDGKGEVDFLALVLGDSVDGRAAVGRTRTQALSIGFHPISRRRRWGGGQGQRGRRGGRTAIAQRCNRGRLQILFQALALAWGRQQKNGEEMRTSYTIRGGSKWDTL